MLFKDLRSFPPRGNASTGGFDRILSGFASRHECLRPRPGSAEPLSRPHPRRSRSEFFALTGTPGTGKSFSAARLPARFTHVEVGDLARREVRAPLRAGAVMVDLRRLSRWLGRHPPTVGPVLVVGHLSHLLPIRNVILLRCHPTELARRLRNGRRTTRDEIQDNVWAEATDAILFEAMQRRRRIWEIDTTHRTPVQVARRIASLIDHPPAPTRRFVDWLAEPSVTEHLLDR